MGNNKNEARIAQRIPTQIKDIPDASSNENDWKSWYSFLKERYGKKAANMLFAYAFNQLASKKIRENEDFIRHLKNEYDIDLYVDRTTFEKIEKAISNALMIIVSAGVALSFTIFIVKLSVRTYKM